MANFIFADGQNELKEGKLAKEYYETPCKR